MTITNSEAEGASRAEPEQVECRPIAIVGVHGRFPKAVDVAEFWSQLETGEVVVGPIPEARRESLLDVDADAATLIL